MLDKECAKRGSTSTAWRDVLGGSLGRLRLLREALRSGLGLGLLGGGGLHCDGLHRGLVFLSRPSLSTGSDGDGDGSCNPSPSRGQVASDALRMPADSGATLTPRCLFRSAQALQALKDFAGQTRLFATLRDATPGNQPIPPVSNPPPNFSSPQLQASPPIVTKQPLLPTPSSTQLRGPHSHQDTAIEKQS